MSLPFEPHKYEMFCRKCEKHYIQFSDNTMIFFRRLISASSIPVFIRIEVCPYCDYVSYGNNYTY